MDGLPTRADRLADAPQTSDLRSVVIPTGLVALTAAVFLLDLAFPLGVAAGVPYVAVVLLSLWLPQRRYRFLTAATVTLLTGIGFLFPLPEGEAGWIGLQNRLIAVFAIWTTAVLGDLLIRRTEALREREERMRSVLDAATSAIITTDAAGVIESCNPATGCMFGYRPCELVGRSISDLVSELDLPTALEADSPPSGKFSGLENDKTLYGRRADGTLFPIDVSLSEVRLGERRLVTAIVHDIGPLIDAQDRAVQSERLAAIGQTITALSHESRNELHALQLGIDLLARLLSDRPDALNWVEKLRGAQDRLQRLLDDVRGFAAPVVLECSECSLSEVWRRAWQSVRAAESERPAELLEQIEAVDVTCRGDGFRLEQVFRNLFENSFAACDGAVRVMIRCTPAEIDGEAGLKLAVIDNGRGLSAEARLRIFEPFFTTKSRGTGLGMAICRRLIEAHGGSICVANSSGGAEFHILLPRDDEAEPAASTESGAKRRSAAEGRSPDTQPQELIVGPAR